MGAGEGEEVGEGLLEDSMSERAKWRICFAISISLLLGCRISLAQLEASQDLSTSSPTLQSGNRIESALKDKRVCGFTIADGVTISGHSVKLALSIHEAKLERFSDEWWVKATVWLKNVGQVDASIPWMREAVDSKLLSKSDNKESFGYQVATVDLYFGRPHEADSRRELRGEAVLYAQPENPAQLINLQPGRWVEVILQAKVVCGKGSSLPCDPHLDAGRMQVSAWWYQRLLTTNLENDCIVSHGAYTDFEVDSAAVDLQIPGNYPNQ